MTMGRIRQILERNLPATIIESASKTAENFSELAATTQGYYETYKGYIPVRVNEYALRGFNLLVAGLVLKDYFTKPDARLLGEFGLDIAVHTLQAAITLYAPDALKVAGISANANRLANIVLHMVSGDSTIPTMFNVIDFGIHANNMYQTFSWLGVNQMADKQSQAPEMKRQSQASQFELDNQFDDGEQIIYMVKTPRHRKPIQQRPVVVALSQEEDEEDLELEQAAVRQSAHQAFSFMGKKAKVATPKPVARQEVQEEEDQEQEQEVAAKPARSRKSTTGHAASHKKRTSRPAPVEVEEEVVAEPEKRTRSRRR